jgi:hypothetical protein
MSILEEAKPEAAFAKFGIYGEAGSGKTYTASLIAIGLHKFIHAEKPIAFAATEPGVDYVLHLFKEAGIKLVTKKSRVFSDLLTIHDDAEKECSILIIDSITHYWVELQEAYMKKNGMTKINWMKHSAPIKAIWRDFSDRYINGKLHVIMCGRSTVIFEDVIDPEDGSKETKKTGTKMKTENEMGYEPSLLVEMSAVQLSPQFGSKLVRRAFIKKDRFSVMDGKLYDNPTFETFMPHVGQLNIGGEHRALELDRADSTTYIKSEESGEKRALNKEILCEEIQNEVRKLYPGQTEGDKLKRIALLEEVFNTNSWTKISTLTKNDVLADGLNVIRAKVYDASKPTPQAVPVIPLDESGNGKKAAKKGARA